jgi:hypothetical protein
VVNAEATRKNRAALELINRTGKLPRLGLGGFLKWTSPISNKSVRDATMPISHEGFRNATMPIMNSGVRNATMPAVGYMANHKNSGPELAGDSLPLRAVGNPAPEVHKHYHFNVHAHGADAAMSIKKSRRQLARQARETLGAAA